MKFNLTELRDKLSGQSKSYGAYNSTSAGTVFAVIGPHNFTVGLPYLLAEQHALPSFKHYV